MILLDSLSCINDERRVAENKYGHLDLGQVNQKKETFCFFWRNHANLETK
jgi:hypothetical protein